MTEQPLPYGAPAPQPTSTYATWGDRALATLWDLVYLWPAFVTMLAGVVLLTLGIASSSDYDTDGAATAMLFAGVIAILVGYVWLFVRQVRNYVVRQGRTGQTWGKAKKGLWVVDENTGAAPGWGSCLGRWLLHALINQAVYLDYLWPLWDKPKVQTLTDKVLTTVVVKRA
ncbi:RDD family protein [Nocardioides sp.]|uniref:RDD family protein n=1 Tax=Nocardioides sp. TaxID=35761 RepID=UPI002BDD8EF0|nr:RDD family protein [Nocardioides sp.]HSX67905.1 RDD family protein [Nocardioides sp.]